MKDSAMVCSREPRAMWDVASSSLFLLRSPPFLYHNPHLPLAWRLALALALEFKSLISAKSTYIYIYTYILQLHNADLLRIRLI